MNFARRSTDRRCGIDVSVCQRGNKRDGPADSGRKGMTCHHPARENGAFLGEKGGLKELEVTLSGPSIDWTGSQ